MRTKNPSAVTVVRPLLRRNLFLIFFKLRKTYEVLVNEKENFGKCFIRYYDDVLCWVFTG